MDASLRAARLRDVKLQVDINSTASSHAASPPSTFCCCCCLACSTIVKNAMVPCVFYLNILAICIFLIHGLLQCCELLFFGLHMKQFDDGCCQFFWLWLVLIYLYYSQSQCSPDTEKPAPSTKRSSGTQLSVTAAASTGGNTFVGVALLVGAVLGGTKPRRQLTLPWLGGTGASLRFVPRLTPAAPPRWPPRRFLKLSLIHI